MEKKADVAARLARNSPAIGAKKAPKLYMVPKTTKPTVNATSTMIQARRESGSLATDCECGMDTFTTFLAGGRKSQNTKHVAAATLRFVLSFDLLVFEYQPAGVLPLALATTGKSSHVKSHPPVERAARPWRYGYVT